MKKVRSNHSCAELRKVWFFTGVSSRDLLKTEAVVQRCSVKKVFLIISQNP